MTVSEVQVEKARRWLYESVEDVKADYGPEFFEEVDDGAVVADLITSMAATGEFPKQVVRELARRELGWVPQAALAYL